MRILRKNSRLTSHFFCEVNPKKISRKKTQDFFSRVLGSIGGKNSRKISRNVNLKKNNSRDFLSIGRALLLGAPRAVDFKFLPPCVTSLVAVAVCCSNT